ncbi:probable inactive serine/threonine-protein kinase scy1 [Tanacetum coccineum]|uniref:Probable inactive serine/threonine-protein kinase scy1 n=1 Tax=Tanacetum coccineum TaxID=301880 RepID=A0ABQ4XJ89_9ASTR
MGNNNSSPQNSVEVIDGAASVQRKTANSFASVLQTKPHKQVVKIMELRNNHVVDGANVAIIMEAVEVSSRFANTLYGYFIGKRLAFPLVENYVKNTWAKYGLKRVQLHVDFFLFQFDSKDGMESVIENGSWLIRLVPLLLNIWTPNTVLKKDVIKQAPVWVKLHHVLTVAYSEWPQGRIESRRTYSQAKERFKAVSLALEFEAKSRPASNPRTSNSFNDNKPSSYSTCSHDPSKLSATYPNASSSAQSQNWESERQNLRDKGLCFRCKEKFAPGHRCKLATFSLLEISNDNEQLVDREVEANENEYEGGINQQDMAEISFHAILSKTSGTTMKVEGTLEGRKVLTLVDSGSTHNFISASLVKQLGLKVDEEPAIRTNTTILLGNLASHLNEGTRKRVLINAFTARALRDTFSPARGAGIMALCATSSYYDAQEIAVRILPNVVVLTIDPDSDVRSKAFEAVEQFLQIVKQYHVKTNVGDNAEVTSSGIASLPGNASILGWAMSSLSIKGKPSEHTPHLSASSSAPNISSVSAASSGVPIAQSTPMVRASSTADIVDQPAPESPTTSTDGWGDLDNGIIEDQESEKDGWDDIIPLEDLNPSPALASIQAAQKRPVAQTKPQASNVRTKTTLASKSEDEEEDLWGSISALPPKSAASKPRNVKPSATTIDNDDPWAAIAAPPPTTRVKPLAAGRGRGSKPSAAPKLGAQRINRTSSGGV